MISLFIIYHLRVPKTALNTQSLLSVLTKKETCNVPLALNNNINCSQLFTKHPMQQFSKAGPSWPFEKAPCGRPPSTVCDSKCVGI